MTGRMRAWAFVVAGVGGCGGYGDYNSPDIPPINLQPPSTALFYQDVAPTGNAVRVGLSTDGIVAVPMGGNLVGWQALGASQVYGDPTFSRLSNGRWAMTATTSPQDPRGGLALQYHEAQCPRVVDSAVRVIPASTAPTCEAAGASAMAKTSQVFEVDGNRYLFTMVNAKIHLVRLSDATRGASDLTSICIRRTPAASLAQLQWGEATVVLDATQVPGLLLSDTAIARRADGTWVLFVKGIPVGIACSAGAVCELCSRGIYRTTSSDLINWSTPQLMVQGASVPDAYVAADGAVRLYYQDFSQVCTTQNVNLAARAPIRAISEVAGGGVGAAATVSIPGEAFETNAQLHYATNANPVLLNATARSALEACLR